MATEDTIEFSCRADYYGRIPEPVPATKMVPDWYKEMDFDPDKPRMDRGVKYCASFFDAMTMGWIVPMPYDVDVASNPEENGMAFQGHEPELALDSHPVEQLGGENNPMMPNPVLKFNTPWFVETPEDVSVLVTKPFNRHEPRFHPFSGIMDTDNKRLTVNSIALWTADDFNGRIEAGIPLVQVIPYNRDGIINDGVVRKMGAEEWENEEFIRGSVITEGGVYKKNWWEPKDGARIVHRDEEEE